MAHDVVLVTGNRNFRDFELLNNALDYHLAEYGILIVGDAEGADNLSLYVAKRFNPGWIVEMYEADWGRHGKAAGPIRNQEMVEHAAGSRDRGMRVIVLGFATETSVEFAATGGTADCLRRVRKAGLPYKLYVSDLFTGPAVPRLAGEYRGV